jgi:hypothetical protein
MLIKQNLPNQELFPFSALEAGFIKGSLGVLCGSEGSGKSEVALRFLAENPSLQAAWVEDDLSIYPCAFEQKGVSLKRVLFIEAGLKNALWCVHQLLRSTLFQVVIYTLASARSRRGKKLPLEEDEVSLRRLQIAAEKAGALVLFLSEAPFSASWPLSAQIQVSRPFPSHTTTTTLSVEPVLNVLKYRGQRACQTEVV